MIKLAEIFSIKESLPSNDGQSADTSGRPPAGPPGRQDFTGETGRPGGSGAGTRVTGDAGTLGALENVLADVRDESMIDWADEARDALAAAIRKGGDQITATLPPFKAGGQEDEGDIE